METTVGDRGEFTVWFDGRKILERGFIMLPSEKKILAAVRQAMQSAPSAAPGAG